MGSIYRGLKPALLMVVVQIVSAGVTIFYKLATNDGMSMRIMVAYRYTFATAVLAPLAFLLERKSRPKLTWMVVFQSFLCGLFGCSLGQNLYVESLNLTSTTFAAAMANLSPAITYILAVALGLEKMLFETVGGKSKVLGAILSIGGAMVLTFYKGVEINLWSSHLIHMHVAKSHGGVGDNHVLGSLIAIGSSVSFSLWLIVQAKMGEKYPCIYSSTALTSMMGSMQAVVYALCMEKEMAHWKLGLNIRLLTVVYCGVVSSALMYAIIAYCVRTKGPLFVSVFQPLALVVVTVAGSVLLGEKLHIGSLLGAVLIVTGLYIVLWGKAQEIDGELQTLSSKSSRLSPEIVGGADSSEMNNNSITVVLPSGTECHNPGMEPIRGFDANLEEYGSNQSRKNWYTMCPCWSLFN